MIPLSGAGFRRQRFPPTDAGKSDGTDRGPSIEFGIVPDLSMRVKFRSVARLRNVALLLECVHSMFWSESGGAVGLLFLWWPWSYRTPRARLSSPLSSLCPCLRSAARQLQKSEASLLRSVSLLKERASLDGEESSSRPRRCEGARFKHLARPSENTSTAPGSWYSASARRSGRDDPPR